MQTMLRRAGPRNGTRRLKGAAEYSNGSRRVPYDGRIQPPTHKLPSYLLDSAQSFGRQEIVLHEKSFIDRHSRWTQHDPLIPLRCAFSGPFIYSPSSPPDPHIPPATAGYSHSYINRHPPHFPPIFCGGKIGDSFINRQPHLILSSSSAPAHLPRQQDQAFIYKPSSSSDPVFLVGSRTSSVAAKSGVHLYKPSS
jgi:hypothetical protein